MNEFLLVAAAFGTWTSVGDLARAEVPDPRGRSLEASDASCNVGRGS